MQQDREYWNQSRYGWKPEPMYESYLIRGNNTKKDQAFWIRYTLLHPVSGPPVGELWIALFSGDKTWAARQAFPLEDGCFSASGLQVRVGDAELRDGKATGVLRTEEREFQWDLSWEASEAPLLLLERKLYDGSFPKAKSVVPAPMIRFRGGISVAGEQWDIEDWVGSQNHNWGSRHTDAYAWGQVMGFEEDPSACLECATARLKFGPVWTPPLTVAVLRIDGRDLVFNHLLRAPFAKARFAPFDWEFRTSNGSERLTVEFGADAEQVVALPYGNPQGGTKICFNTKVGRASLCLEERDGTQRRLHTANKAAFEILQDREDPRVELTRV